MPTNNHTPDLTDEQVQKILQGVSIPPQPQIMVDLQMEQLSPDCSIKVIADLIGQDIGLSGSILKTVNSPFYGLSNKITSITQAVNLMGIRSVVNLVNAQSIRGELSDDQIVALGKFWDSSMEVAMAASFIAKQIGFQAHDEAYTLGLFHNCGIPLLMMRFAHYDEVIQEAYNQTDERVIDVENRHLKTNHAVVGYYVGKSWNLPRYLCEAIHEHHTVAKVLNDEHADANKRTLLAILKMAEHICGTYKVLGSAEADQEWESIKQDVLIYVGMSEYDFASLEQQIAEMGLGESSY